jgi:hypothetical protein
MHDAGVRYDDGGRVMGEVHPLFSAWLIYQSSMKGMTLDEYLVCDSKDDPAFSEMPEDNDWGFSSEAGDAGDIEREACDWGNGEIVVSPTRQPCDSLAFDGETNVRH